MRASRSTSRRFARRLSQIASVLAFAIPCSALAQERAGTIRGTVDPAGLAPAAAVAGAPVSLDGTPFRTATDSAGRFVLTGIPAASYALVVTISGREVRRPVTVSAGEVANVTIVLESADVAGAQRLEPVVVSAATPLHVIGHLPDVDDNIIYSGKKTEVIVMDSLHANSAQDMERQILGRVPGAHFSETEAAGFPSNGVGFRGLDPTQSVEMNTRQNGVNIAADLYGYPETYYTPPAQALDRIEVVRGAGSLAFGPQFGGVINYVVRRGATDMAPTLTSEQTAGSFGLVNSFNALAGGSSRLSYYGFVHVRREDGWRPSSDFQQVTGYASATYHASDRLTLGLEYTLLRNRIHMPGGLSDAQFEADPEQSFRTRNWLASPWSVTALRIGYRLAPGTRLESVVSYVGSDRHLVWRNEDGGPAALDTIDPATGTFVPREVERETFHNWTMESRLRVDHALLGRAATLATGIRTGYNRMERFEGGTGSTDSDFDMRLVDGTWERALRFGTTNLAVFAEELIRVSDRLSVTPGVRYEYLRSTASGYTDVDSSFAPRTFSYPLFGIGAVYATGPGTELYANATEAYRPVPYSALTPFGSITRIDPDLGASRGYNTDLGWRGTLGNVLKFDVGAFYLWYGDRVGTRTETEGSGDTFTETTNIGNSVHKGIETYIEFDPLSAFGAPRSLGSLDIFNSFAYVDAHYISGELRGNRVELAPRVLERVGLTYGLGPASSTLQVSHTSDSYGDANNSFEPIDDTAAGFVPGYTVLDWSGRLRFASKYTLEVGINNLTDAHYFTKRTGEYPGPGILPGIGRSIYAGIGATF
jgi:Fe(3+) dicitrate transport protein